MALQFVSSKPTDNLRIYDYVIDSKDRLNYTLTSSNNFRVDLSNMVPGRISAYGLKSAVIPKTNYNIPAIRNTFTFNDGVADYTITITPGNYTMTQLLTEIVTQLNALGPNTFAITYSDISGKTTWTTTGPAMVINPSLDASQGSILYKMGFVPGVSYTGVSITSPNVANISGVKTAYIRIKQLTQYIRNTTNSMMNFKVDLSCPFGSIIYFADEAKYHQYFIGNKDNISSLGSFDIALTDEYGAYLDLNGSDWSFVLQLITVP